MIPCAGLNLMESQISILVWEGLTNREIAKIVGTSEQMIKNNRLSRAFDKLGVWSRLEMAMYMASHGGKNRLPETKRQDFLGAGSIYTSVRYGLNFSDPVLERPFRFKSRNRFSHRSNPVENGSTKC